MARRIAAAYQMEPISALASWSRRLAVFSLVSSIVAVVIVRFGVLDFKPALTTFFGALACAGLSILVGLAAFTSRFPRQMSGGQQQRVALARALVIKPEILLLDEPLSNLDAKLREEMQIELRQIQRSVGTTTILVTHDQAEAMALSDRLVVMNHGRIEQIGPPHEAYERPATPFVASFLGKTNLVNGETVRPEKIAFAAAGLAGTVRTRIFQGSHWLYQVETAGGLVTVIRQNTGEPVPAEGDAVNLAWQAAA